MQKNYPTRKNNRLEGYDYSTAGYYFVTICTKDKKALLGQVVGTTAPGRPSVELAPIGQCVAETISIANKGNVKIDKYIIMPNHLHMIVILSECEDDRGRSSLQQVVRNIKSYVTKYAGYPLWQSHFHDHIIRNHEEYLRIWQYINENPVKWTEDRYYVER